MFDNHPFAYHAPTPDQIEKIALVREALRTAHELLTDAIPASRERSLAITKLEECSMWANKAIVFAPET
jgi:hypothetical protein